MRIFSLFTASLLPIATLAAKKFGDSTYDSLRAQSLSTPNLKLDDKLYNKLTAAPRDYAVAILLTALPSQFGCQLCQEFQPEWDLLAKSWNKGDKEGESRLLFGTLDFLNGKPVFQSLMLQTAPVLLLFHPTTGPNAKVENSPTRYDFTQGLVTAEFLQSFIARHLPDGPHPPVNRPVNWVKIVSTTVAVLGGISAIYVAAPYITPVIQNRNLWAAVSIIAVLLFTSGHMFNHIRKVPYFTGNGRGGATYFAGGFQNQFGIETQIVAAIYGILSFATISIALKVPRITDPRLQQASVFIWSGVMFAMYSFLLSIFRIKNGGYPFFLPPF
ncbi:hypothetical protein EJ05DRAFT_116365 [Pseudovirgaria hyperparasitica]|uniref:Oligosaccharyl transferas-like protein subunit n=1 Tax=Pseudovirgaria hyperparasitica TaxID=470096 RepID=A0A6A6W2H8_9PEZI|nr:uncharacterized protein EJ05DRAFT_116365 [Pseudovirgaria hyperparasitica]KAF2755797.1 hypothetical protein EJ05DRAFT_116365 [Pseudovirgaria hyperparasitica]